MTVITAARIPRQPTGQLPTEVDLTTLPDVLQQVIETALESARNAPNNDEYFRHMTTAILAAGIHTRHGELARCACDCMCDVLYDADNPNAHLFHDGAHEIPQCPACADDHPGTNAE
jgi:NAD-dependent SIR2 family protein deacetylase